MIRIFGIELSLHPLFVIIMLFSVITGQFLELLTLFTIVFIHEMGHVVAALLAGVTVKSVQLLPFGGVAVIEDHGRLTASREIGIALAGPLQNGIMIVIALGLQQAGYGNQEFLTYFIHANAMIGLFNLVPVLPLDGGKVLQATISLVLPYYYTLLWTGRVSVAASVLVIIYAVLPLGAGGGLRLNMVMIGAFLLYSNFTDHRNLPYRFVAFLMNREAVYEYHLRTGSVARPIVALSAKPLDDILRLFKRNQYHFIYVLNGKGNVVAVVPEQRLISTYFGI
ncbi:MULTISPECIES: M50 family metallopeptidase [Paenibacillus]|uniref:M50 family metallopeptidase n=1 Tax=Paenibacillus TaxID=44249 RepID=UPI0004F6C313|nr:M50 family metallopeptidase [Paenibacillus odorifer]AIQ76152.1 Zn-dependent protease [Paenibacillus odorifer]OMD13960.1 Zn-dependent protease [Paenibacillus odorifer]OME17311.1 Zn-dependent protease [Paenibacillus odorifer]OZQ74414.1 Zn-dependent protease [Paenibacillus odorifer]